ncbi:MAG: galactose-1-phosphate uridylyltransferase [Planctomycetaceae bacterium]|nr:galactose-1-phosphate uridylyltransferase [Planctomycetaceae bacterium]
MRRNPLTGEWTLYAPERAARPSNYQSGNKQESSGFDPFAEGNETKTTTEILAVRDADSVPNGPGWQVRAIFNKYPAVDFLSENSANGVEEKTKAFLFESRPVYGAHDVIVESPEPITRFHELSLEQMKNVFSLYQARWKQLSEDSRIKYALLFKNEGQAAGASLEHVHSQCIGLPFVPAEVERKLKSAENYQRERGRNFFEEWLEEEIAAGTRVIRATEKLVVLCPFFSQFPYETWIVPRYSSSRFELASAGEVSELGEQVHFLLNRYAQLQEGLPFNFMLHSTPFGNESDASYRWYLQITPRLSQLAGLELGSGVLVNLVLPETAAKELKGA